MPKSRGRRPSRRSQPGRRRPKAPPADIPALLIPDSVTDAELTTVQLIAAAMGTVPPQPACPGPVLVHADGAFECHGPDCPGATVIFHHEDVIDPCRIHPEIRTLHACPRCLTHSAGAELSEHICSGQLVEHDDGTNDCTASQRCLGIDIAHVSTATCRFHGPCPRGCVPL